MMLFSKHVWMHRPLQVFISLPVIMCLLISCEKEKESSRQDIKVNKSEIEINGVAQSFSFDIAGDYDWLISAPNWMGISPREGSGSKTITVTVDENLYEKRQGEICIYWGPKSNTSFVSVSQSSVYDFSTEEILVNSFSGYSDTYDLYAKILHASLSEGVDDKKYEEMIPVVENYQVGKAFAVKPFSDGYVFLVPGFSLRVNGKPALSDMAIYINQSWMNKEDQRDISYYQDMSRSEFLEILKNSGLEYSMLATWPDSPTIRFELSMAGKNKIRYYLGESESYNIELRLNYSLLNYLNPDSGPSIGFMEYALIHDRFENRQFKDVEDNLYTINVLSKKLQDIDSIDISLEAETCSYSFSTASTYPVISIKKNDELFYEIIPFMYVEFLGESLNTGEQAYCTGFESELAIGGEVIRIDFDSGIDDDSKSWFQFSKNRLFDYYDGEFHNSESSIIRLYPVNDAGKKPLAGVALKAEE